MTNYKFFLEFKNDGFGKVQIDEPIGFNTLIWVLKQKDKGHGRDVSFNDGESEVKFVWTRNHYLDKILFYNQIYGFESKVRFYVEIDEIQTILGDLDFSLSKTDGLEYFSCKVIQDSKLLTVNRQSKIKVDVLSDKDLSGNYISKLTPINVLVKAKAVFQESKWESKETVTVSDRGFFNYCDNIVSQEIPSTLTPSSPFLTRSTKEDLFDNFTLIKAEDNINGLVININNLSFKTTSNVKTKMALYLNINKTLFVLDSVEDKSISLQRSYTYSIPKLNRGDIVSFFFSWKITETYTPTENPIANVSLESITMTAESTSYNSITKAFRLCDVMKQVVKSSSGLGIKAPRYETGGEFYDLFLFDGKLLRSIVDKPFLISLEEISRSITMMNADYEVNDDVYFGIEKDFYTLNEMWFFDKTQFSGMNIMYNPEMTINKFSFKFKRYQSLKENEQPNSADTIHGELDLLLQNKMVENSKVVDVDWSMDSFLSDEARKKSVEISTNTAYQNDTDIFCLDCLANQSDLEFTEISEFNHEWNQEFSPTLGRLILRSNGTLNFNIIGLVEGARFVINAPDKNAGVYSIYKVSNQELQLTWISGGVMTVISDGIRFTEYTYTIPKEQIPYISRTNEGMATQNIKSPQTFSNLAYSVKRNIENYYSDYLATCNLYNKEKAIKVTEYKHNGECIIEYKGKTTKENNSLLPKNPILNPLMYNEMVFSNFYFDEFLELQNKVRSVRGYFRTIGNDGNPIKAFIKEMKYDALKKELTVVAKGKYEPINMTITKSNKLIIINEEVSLLNIIYEIKDDKLYIYDNGRQLLYKPIFYNMVSINGSTTEVKQLFIKRMDLL